jgi:hypothetical protein
MSKNLSLKSLKFKPLLNKYFKRYSRHTIFGAILLILLVYLIIVFKISSLAKAEPGPDQTAANPLVIPKVDQSAINHIQSLEQNNTNIHSLFESARNNPFQE